MTDFRALCAELADRLDDALTYTVQSDTERSMRQLIDRTRAELAQPEPQGLTEDDMNDLADDLLGIVLPEGSGARLITRALQLWGRPVIEPVPVSKRLPGEGDCDADGECWWFDPAGTDGAWYVDTYQGNYTHWLPHHALPVPTSEEVP